MGAIGSYFSNFAPISSPGLLITDYKLYRWTKISTDISIDYRPTLDRCIERLSSDYRPSVDRPSTECRPITDRYIGQVSTNYRRSVGERKAISAETHLERLSAVSRPSVDPLSTAISTDCRPSVDRLSTECRPLYRPLYRPISRSTLPTVNKIRIDNIFVLVKYVQ